MADDVALKFGFFIGQPSPSFEEMLRQGKRYEKAGFDSFWYADHTLIPPPERCFVPDAFMVLAAMATHTKKLTLSTSVTCVHKRNYFLLAQIIASLDQLSKGRAILGIGSGEAMNLDPLDIPWDRPVARTLEAIELMKRLWKEDYLFDFEGEFYNLKQGFLQLEPYQKPHPPIYYAANGPRTLELLGRYWDGWLPVIENPKIYRKHVDIIEKGAKKAGRSIKDIDCGMSLFTAVSNDSDEALKALLPDSYFLVSIPKKLEEAGYDISGLEGISEDYYIDQLLVSNEDQEKYQKAGEIVTEEMIRDFLVVGTPEECIEQIDRFRKAGMNHLLIVNFGPDLDKTIEYYEKEIIPYFKE